METTEVVKVEKNSLAKFQALQEIANDLGTACNELVISDETTEAVATQIISKANELNKNIDKKRKELKDPYLKAGKAIDAAAKTVTENLTEAVKSGKEKLLVWKQEVKAQQEKERAYIQGFKDKLEEKKSSVEFAIDNADTVDELKLVGKEQLRNFMEEDWGPIEIEAKAIHIGLKKYGGAKMAILKDPSNEALKVQKEQAKEVLQETVDEAGTEELMSIEAQAPAGIRKTWTYEVVDIKKVSAAFLTVDSVKVQAWAKQMRAGGDMQEECIRDGIRYYQKESVTIR